MAPSTSCGSSPRAAASPSSENSPGTLTDAAGAGIGTVTDLRVTIPLTASGSCDILHPEIGPIDLDLLGLVVHLDQIVLDIDAESGPRQPAREPAVRDRRPPGQRHTAEPGCRPPEQSAATAVAATGGARKGPAPVVRPTLCSGRTVRRPTEALGSTRRGARPEAAARADRSERQANRSPDPRGPRASPGNGSRTHMCRRRVGAGAAPGICGRRQGPGVPTSIGVGAPAAHRRGRSGS